MGKIPHSVPLTIFTVVLLVFGSAFVAQKMGWWRPFGPTATDLIQGIHRDDDDAGIELVAEDLRIPWDIAFLPDGDMLVTERPGMLRRIGADRAVVTVDGVAHVGEGGLLGIALHPDFGSNSTLYLYMTTRVDEGLTNRIMRYTYEDGTLTSPEVILRNIPGAGHHDGGMIAFGPDGNLYVTTGDAGKAWNAQDKSSLAGKILRMKDDGSVPDDNPFGTLVWSYGHRNPQGLTWDDDGRLWSSEHGRSGLKSGMDEVNLIEKGKNYGWPVIEGDARSGDMVVPKVHSGARETWAPGAIAAVGDTLFFSGLRGESLYAAEVQGDAIVQVVAHFREDYGRLRMVRLGPDGYLYVSTSNQDGRGEVRAGDDRILKIHPRILNGEGS